MDDKELSKEIINSLIYETSHINVKCNFLKQQFINMCEYNISKNITLNYINKNCFCIKLYNDYYDCYKNDKLSEK
jgi:hypothetical protein